ncbi:GNAT family N-acetyltransferase [Paenibacillus sp. KQZ6P-2]|uniref:GNAT family N-acetyltransferase n=1 Tax=Paenibacillus mangrovi TaxID=2931978 RepID=A0A9X1WLN9_9BACL|nr:GNAT family N-acetyltransferase [Paenibacillus mangrovi]MCJ8010956.1 GNAT family N-acetyltransferase [Paenibacillus mangrovi]
MSTHLVMERSHLLNLGNIELPSGFTLHNYQQDYEKDWENIIQQSFGQFFDFSMMTDDPSFHPNRVLFVISPEGIPVSTASAFWQETWGDDAGYLHMVATDPDYRGMGLGFAVSLAAMQQMIADNRARAILETEDHRLSAIKIYLKLGYEPKITEWEHVNRWRELLHQLGFDNLLNRLFM